MDGRRSRGYRQSRSRSVSPNDRNRNRKDDRRPSRNSPRRTHFVCIRGLPAEMRLDTLQLIIVQNVGKYLFVQILQSSVSSSTKKALVEFDDEDLARKCIRRMDQMQLGSRTVDVSGVEDVEAFLHKHGVGASGNSVDAEEISRSHGGGRSASSANRREASSSNRYMGSIYDRLGERPGESQRTEHYNAARSSRSSEARDANSPQSEWLFSGDVHKNKTGPYLDRDDDAAGENARLQTLQEKLWSSVWKTRQKKKESAELTTAPTSMPTASASMNMLKTLIPTASTSMNALKIDAKEIKSIADIEGQNQLPPSSNDSVALVALEVMTGAFHLRRALDTMRKSDAPHDAFRASALFLRQFNEELTDWIDMYFSRDTGGSRAPALPKLSNKEEKEKSRNLVEVMDEPPTPSLVMPAHFQHSAAAISFSDIGTIQTPAAIASWFMIGPAQPRFSAAAAIRRGALKQLIDVPRDKTKAVLLEFAHIAPATTLSRCIRAIAMGGYVDLDWFHHIQGLEGVNTRLGDSGLSFANWYRCFEFLIKIGETIGAPSDYLTSLTAYRRVIEMWWRQVAAADIQAASLLWLPFYELFDKSWRMYAARSPEYRDKLHIFDAWWVFHQLDPTALKLRVPLPPYDAQASSYVRQVAAHYDEMLRKPIPSESAANYTTQRFDTGLDACSVCGDCDHKVLENGRAVPIFCPFTSRRISWCLDIYESVCENEVCQREGKHVCAHCGNRGHVVQTCPNCKFLVS